ncbi:axotactin isoform X1 [Anastrepha ludens]|uniref:axotactin isoform X1 n=1 Tax=Anastrepha ludens TaxID=28586 RepID=UPI0023B07529|nr:axotactin isoform X1 [Anastrepha ludens]XP_053955452.1 axotactin isoform X1 [Anastrepha ludens]XP_053955453.1 axotactin isoform X1 [Anastrepha ludens]XP_053955454.1 axotactin isoform X1 [Anastrepha ludens]XP_053955455.1 axotactin isoform X1 [Anastrepha ludens]XP_053955456.1 axotactin isoform X1 [Anastrepha ludens]
MRSHTVTARRHHHCLFLLLLLTQAFLFTTALPASSNTLASQSGSISSSSNNNNNNNNNVSGINAGSNSNSNSNNNYNNAIGNPNTSLNSGNNALNNVNVSSNSVSSSSGGVGINSGSNNIDLLNIGGSNAGGVSVAGSSANSSNIIVLPREKLYEKCTGPGDPGPCKQYIYKWRYEPLSNECTTFIWGGCDGNSQNRFNTEAECLYHCIGGPHTLPPFLRSTTSEPSTTESAVQLSANTVGPLYGGDSSDSNPMPFEQRGPELTFAETGKEKTFVFAKNNTFIQMDGDIIQTFQLRLCREISFQFRTRLPHGLLVYHNVKNPDRINLDPYALYVIVEKGQLKVVHVFGKHSTSVTVGEGLNRDEWHSVMVRIDVHGARLIARVDRSQEEVYLKGLNHDTNYGVSTNLPSVVLVGGLSSEEKLHGVKYIIESFVGCIRNVVLSSGKAASDLLPIAPLVATKHENVNEGCSDKCHSRHNLCFVGSRCINHYYDISCDCFGSHYEGEHCDIYTATIMTLRGSSYVSYRIYDWKDRVHSSNTRISLMFRTQFDDSALFYASGESLKHQYIAASIKNQSIHVEMDFGDNVMSTVLTDELTRSNWHNLTIQHEQRTVRIILDQQMKILEIPATSSGNLLFDPEIYFGGGPDLHKKKGLQSQNNFVGSLKYVYYNDVSILYELHKSNPKVHYHGVLEAEFQENEVNVIPITYPFATSHIWWPINHAEEFNIKFDFRSSRTAAVLAYSDVTTTSGNGFWEIRLSSDKLSFDLVPDLGSNLTHSTVIKINRATSWHSVELDYKAGEITFTVDYHLRQSQMFGLTFNIGDKLIIGSSLKSAASGLVGCIRDIEINGHLIEPRHVVKTERVVGEVALDNCNYIDPCKRPNTCEHGGKCFVKDDRVTCDCKHTGYIGKNCHFTKYRKTCEELALLGYTKSDVYLIDIDGNGVFPPAHVKCDFQSLENATKTIVEHNLPSQVDVRSSSDNDFKFNIRYREFSPDMLQELISHSLYCTQYIKYDCYKAPLELHSATWFTSSSKNLTVDFLGNAKRGACPCSINKTCVDPNQSCNCDVKENKWYSDEGYYNEPYSLGITDMYFLQQKDLEEDSQGRITLGPLECVETNTQKYVVTFTTSQSYIEVPGWRKGDIAFSFRTTGEKAILLFQPPIRPNHPSFMVALTGDYQLTFNFTLSTGTTRELVINSHRKLNGGEWHKIWIDYNQYHVRFMINTDYQMVDLLAEEEFGPFEGSMYIGGATADLLKKLSVKAGLIGCFRGLVVNGEILDIYSYMSVHLSEIIKDCKPSCVPSPCKNGAQCKELWSTFQCVCSNPWAHIGEFCETNINEKALTFITRESFLMRNYISTPAATPPFLPAAYSIYGINEERDIIKDILTEDILINLRTYDANALVFYANDHYNNFVHLYISAGREIVFLYNYGDEIVNLTIVDETVSSLNSIQVAIEREEQRTTMHVNEQSVSVERGMMLLDEYSNKPWINPEKEVLSPHRPPAPPTEYFQFNIGGYDPANLLRPNTDSTALQGYIGCVRGLKIGTNLIDLADINERNISPTLGGVLPNCQIKCDAEPCKNGGICKENFAKQESTCDCEHTSFLGEFCMEEKGADFSGESTLLRKFELTGKVDYVRLQLAFSSFDLRRANRVMLLLQPTGDRSYYLMVAINADGHLLFEEDREGPAVGAHIDRSFLNNARHSIYYIRNGSDATLYIDRDKVELTKVQTRAPVPTSDVGGNRVQIGGINTTDARFAVFKSYSGCLSNIYIQVNNYVMKPLEEYMLFTKSGADNITVIHPQGLRSAQCIAKFDISEQPSQEPMVNVSLSTETWVEDPPQRVLYVAKFGYDVSEKEDSTQVVFITLTSLFVIIIICCLIEVYRSHRAYKKRIERQTDEDIIWSKEQATKMHESPALTGTQPYGYKMLPQDEKKPGNGATLVGILKNGNAAAVAATSTAAAATPAKENGSTKKNGDIPLGHIDTRIDEEDEDDDDDDDGDLSSTDVTKVEMDKTLDEALNAAQHEEQVEQKEISADAQKDTQQTKEHEAVDTIAKEGNADANKSSNEKPSESGGDNVENKATDESIKSADKENLKTTPTATPPTRNNDGLATQANTAPLSTVPQNPEKETQTPAQIDGDSVDGPQQHQQTATAPATTNGHGTLPNEIRSDAPEDSDSIPSISSPEATPSKQLPYERAQSTPPFVVKSPKPKRRLLPTVNFRLPKDLNKQNGETPTNQPPTTSVDSSDGDEEASPMLPPTSTTTPNDAAPPSTEPHVGIEVPSAPPEIDNVPVIPFRTKSNPRLQVKPAYIDDAHRQFWNPISYLGGPHLLPRDRNSITSVLSLD